MIIIDVRQPFEYGASHVEGAINVPLDQIASENTALSEIDPGEQIVVYCNSGSRSGAAAQILQQLGFSNVVNGINQQQVRSKLSN